MVLLPRFPARRFRRIGFDISPIGGAGELDFMVASPPRASEGGTRKKARR